MSWTAPRTWVTGEVETASIFNTHVRDNLLFLKGGVALSTAVTASAGPTVGTTQLLLATAPAFVADGSTLIEVSFSWAAITQSVATDAIQVLLYDGATIGSGTQLAGVQQPSLAANNIGGITRTVITPAAGSHTYTARLARTSGTGTASMTASSVLPAVIAVRQVN